MDLEQLLQGINGFLFVNGLIVGGTVGIYLGARMAMRKPGKGNNVIAVVPFVGNIMPGNSPSNINSNKIIKTLETLSKNKKIKGIIFDINSGGGTVYQSKEIADYIQEMVTVPTVALARDVCASGAYMIACGTDAIVAREESAVGSIGVITAHFAAGGLLEKLGIKYEVIKAGKHKGAHLPLDEMTREERAITQSNIDTIYESFVSYVSSRRAPSYGDDKKVPIEEHIRKLATGDIFFGREALNLGLIDVIGSMDEAVYLVEKLGDFKHSDIYRIENKTGLLARLSSRAGYSIGKAFADGLITNISDEKKIIY